MTKNRSNVGLIALGVAVLILLFGGTWLGCVRKVPAGHVGVKVYLLGGDKGVDSEVLGVGRYLIGLNEELYLFPTFTQTYVWTRDKTEGSENNEEFTFQTKKGMTVTADVVVSYKVDPSKVSFLFQTYRQKIDEITHIHMRNWIRDSLINNASTFEANELYGEGKTELLDRVNNDVRQYAAKFGIIIEKVYWISSPRLPAKVTQALNDKIEATQRAEKRENEVREALAQAQIDVAKAKGEAEALREKARSVTPQLLEYEKIKTQQMAIEKWNGSVPTTVMGKDAVPFINLK